MNKNKVTYNILIYMILVCFAVLCFGGVCYFNNTVEVDGVLPFYIEINSENANVDIVPWLNAEDGFYYVFLPSGCKTLIFHYEKATQISIDGLNIEQVVDIEAINVGSEYTAVIESKIGTEQAISVIFMHSDCIPALFINTESGNMDYINIQKGNAERATFQILSQDESSIKGNITSLAGRGNTSWTNCEKRGYKFSLNEAESLLGLKASSEWILTANARSNYLSNSIAFWLEDEIGMKYTTNAVFVDLYFNGEYHGNYILCEKISTGDNGIPLQNLEKANEEANPGEKVTSRNQYADAEGRMKAYLWKQDPVDISGGYLIERDVPEYYADENCGIVLSTGDHYVIHEPSRATVSEAKYLWEYMEELHQAVASLDGYNQSGRYYTEYLDIESFALKYVLEEFLAFNDAGRSSAYYFKDANDVLRAGPGWDFEGAFLGNARYLTMLNGTSYSTALFEQLMQHDDFRELVIILYNTRLRPAIQALQEHKLFELRDMIAKSAEMDIIRWKREDFFASCEDILAWIDTRVRFLDQHWNHGEEWLTLKFISSWSNNHYLYLRPGESVTPVMVAQFNIPQVITWNDSSGEQFQYNEPIYDSIVLYGVSNAPHKEVIYTLMEYSKQVLPEIVFVAGFLIISILFVNKTRRGRWKNDI